MALVPEMAFRKEDSIIHRLHPITKLVFLVCFCILVLVLANLFFSLLFLVIILLLIKLAKIPLRVFARRARFIIMFTIVLFLLQVIFVDNGRILFWLIPELAPGVGPFVPVTTLGVERGVVIACRFLCIIASSFLFVATTHPNDFAYALMQIGLPYRYGFTLITTLRFLPLFGSEFNVVRRAQIARGMDTAVRPRTLMRTIKLTFLPLLVSGMSKVDALSISMEGRGFGLHKKRTFVRTLKFTGTDTAITMIIILTTVLLSLWTMLVSIPIEYHL
ncbi:MAG: energy-coupling factor transporter transmembrane protein EcfT [Methanomassiliicoccales archaeon]|nr:energy-coupling factor transporter transmembrane protein EcfT [Methanomassiliicoccales archaeon]NYT14375.1 energy-coupling factor transporter transmembrane protein EcfT [Methanomassiliicoccales archaeon]